MGRFYIGIDGGGSNVRAAVVDESLRVLGTGHGSAVNPGVVGHTVAMSRIHRAVADAISEAGVHRDAISAVGIGIAGAAANHAEAWLREVLTGVLPRALAAPSSDVEIALIGAHGGQPGVLVLAGTGSVALGVDHAGRRARAGGWGYLLGDEGGGFWLGVEAMRAVARATDSRGPATTLQTRVFDALQVNSTQAMVQWLYGLQPVNVQAVARLAPLVCEAAVEGDPVAEQLVKHGAQELAGLVEAVITRLSITQPRIAFAGSLLTEPTPVRDQLCRLLGIAAPVDPLYPPVIGAALLAKMTAKGYSLSSRGG
ncbi:MAG: BadF/BadG/BcrA/BcrD ATPase family protein [Anaerolineae bacterium]